MTFQIYLFLRDVSNLLQNYINIVNDNIKYKLFLAKLLKIRGFAKLCNLYIFLVNSLFVEIQLITIILQIGNFS